MGNWYERDIIATSVIVYKTSCPEDLDLAIQQIVSVCIMPTINVLLDMYLRQYFAIGYEY